jgi:hypothetical protein
MISVNNQISFLELIRPPTGCSMTYCIGTTFTLDLTALTQVALSCQGESARPPQEFEETKPSSDDIDSVSNTRRTDIITAFKLLNNFRNKAVVFYHSCRIQQIPRALLSEGKTNRQRFLFLLDSCLKNVSPELDHSSFHPKFWLFRYDPLNKSGSGQWRLIITTRNLTCSREWEVQVTLHGKEGKRSLPENRAIGQFLKHLGNNAGITKKELLQKAIRDLQKVEFEMPDGFSNFEFQWKAGRGKEFKVIDASQYNNIIAVSPFLSSEQLAKFQKTGDVLITSSKDIWLLKDFPELLKNTFVFDCEKQLHSKMYLCPRKNGKKCDLYVGSANLTNAAISSRGANTECLIKLETDRNILDEFKKYFIFANVKKRIPNNWLRPIDANFLNSSEANNNQDKELEPLENVRNALSLGSFYLIKRKRQWMLSWKGKRKIIWPDGFKGQIHLPDSSNRVSLGAVVEHGVKVSITVKTPTAFLWIETFSKNHSLCFGTIAEVERKGSSGLDEAIETLADNSDLSEILHQILSNTFTGRSKGKGLSGNDSKTPSKNHDNVKHVRTETFSYLEPLLFADLSDAGTVELIDTALKLYERKKPEEAKQAITFWKGLKSVAQEVYHG